MSEFDELDLLRDADPVSSVPIPSADQPGPRALRERIVMDAPGTKERGTRVPALIGAAAAVVLIAAAGVVLATGGSERPDPDPLPPGTGGSAMCIEQYSLDTLPNRGFALDGTVLEVSGDEIRLQVNGWFKGGDDAEVTLEGAGALSGLTSIGDPIPLDPGTRLLVSGDDGFAWVCGFTQLYDAAVAAQWEATLS